jgi:hypothetical protein
MPRSSTDPNIVKTGFSTNAMLPAPSVEGWLRRRLVRLGLKETLRPELRSAFAQNKGVYRFETDDGRVAIVPVSLGAGNVEGIARDMAIDQLRSL